MNTITSDSRARLAARRVGLRARKSQRRANNVDNLGGFQIVDPATNRVVKGPSFELSAQEVLDYCTEKARHPGR